MISRDSLESDASVPKGFLIDLDLAKQIDPDALVTTDPSSMQARRRTGTMIFMAIEVLMRIAPHTWRHDLESFFYVLIWLCVTGPPDRNPESRKALYASWSAKDAASNKIAQMTQAHMFRAMLAWFAPSMIPLADLVTKIRALLFPALDNDFGVATGTLNNRAKVYQDIIKFFDEEINSCDE